MTDLDLPTPEEVVLACRRAEAARRRALPDPLPLPRPLGDAAPARLRVVVLLPRTDVGGGARILVEHANRLADRGHEVTLLGHGPSPDWAGLRTPYRQVPWGLDLHDAVPDADVLLAGYWDQVRAARATGLPVLHLEQGDAHLYEEIGPADLEEARRCLQAASATLTLSGAAQGLLRERYAVEATVVPNALDHAVFHPDAPVPAAAPSRPYLVSVGWDGNAFKGLDVVRAVWQGLRDRGHDLDLVRISPSPAVDDWGTVVVRPPQAELAGLLRGAAVYLGASRYETFPLPPLEAMGCGTPVVSTSNVGVLEYAQDGRDALLRPVDDVPALTDAVEQVLTDPALAARLRDGGLATAARFDWDRIVAAVEDQLRAVVLPDPVLDPAWRLDPLDPVEPGGAARLRRSLASTRAREVQVPLLHALDGGGEVARWTTVARRKKGAGTARVHVPARTTAPYSGTGSARLAALGATPAAALPLLLADAERATGPAAAVAVRWLALAVLRAGNAEAALAACRAGLAAHPDHADLASLAAVAAAVLQRPEPAEALAGLAELVGTGARYDEWFTRLPL